MDPRLNPQIGDVLERDGLRCEVTDRKGDLIEYTANGETQNAVHLDDWKLWAKEAV